MNQSSQKFIARNRPPRVQIEYEVETYGSEKKVQLPFVMAVLADLSGKSERRVDDVAQRRFADIDVDNFDERVKALAPRVAFTVPNTLGGEGQLAIDLSFEAMEDFSPAAVAAKVGALQYLLRARILAGSVEITALQETGVARHNVLSFQIRGLIRDLPRALPFAVRSTIDLETRRVWLEERQGAHPHGPDAEQG